MPDDNTTVKDLCNDFDQVWYNDTALKIILYLMKNNKEYWTREEISLNSNIKISTLERYLPKLASSKYHLISERLTYGDKFRAHHVKEYKINQKNPIIKSLDRLLNEIKKYNSNKKLS